MSFETIKIHRDYPIVNGYVALPPNEEDDKEIHLCQGECDQTVLDETDGEGVRRFNQRNDSSFLRLNPLTYDGKVWNQ